MKPKKLASGKWQANIHYRDANGDKKTKKASFNTKKEATNFHINFLNNLNKLDDDFTFDQIGHLWIAHGKTNHDARLTTLEKTRMVDVFFKPLKDRKMSNIKTSDYLKMRNKIANMDYSKTYKNKLIMYLKAVARFADVFYEIPDKSKPIQSFKVTSSDKTEPTIWTPEEFDQFLSCVNGYVYKAFFVFLYRTGARKGEARGMWKTDVHDDTIDIKHPAPDKDNLKNYESARTIWIDDILKEWLDPLLKNKGTYLFGDELPISNKTIDNRLHSAIEHSGVPSITVHGLRHSHATYLINSGASVVSVSKRLGHANIKTTMDTYVHLLRKTDDEMKKLIEEM